MAQSDKRRQIMDAAEKLYTSRRFHEITLDHIAQSAEVGKGTVYRYFKDKDDLFLQMTLTGLDDLCALIERSVSEQASFRDQLAKVCRELAKFADSRRQLICMISSEEMRVSWCHGEIRERLMTHRKKLALAMARILQKGINEGALRADIPAEALAEYLLGLMRTRGRSLDDMPESVRASDLVVDLFCRGAGMP
jgi:TetR/AcrR family transcriptional regulator, fatty acid metabolism regulator protein